MSTTTHDHRPTSLAAGYAEFPVWCLTGLKLLETEMMSPQVVRNWKELIMDMVEEWRRVEVEWVLC